MRVGRPPLGPALVDGLEGGELEKERLRAMLATLAGTCTIDEACSSVGLGRSRFLELRERALEGGLEALAPGVPGRPPKRVEVGAEELDGLRQTVDWLRVELETSRLRTEIALVMPEHLTEPVSKPPPLVGKVLARALSEERRSGARRHGTERT